VIVKGRSRNSEVGGGVSGDRSRKSKNCFAAFFVLGVEYKGTKVVSFHEIFIPLKPNGNNMSHLL
jgi:hypothetical protein